MIKGTDARGEREKGPPREEEEMKQLELLLLLLAQIIQ
jgi:hypothetical protein